MSYKTFQQREEQCREVQLHNKWMEVKRMIARVKELEQKEKHQWAATAIKADMEQRYQQAWQQVFSIRVASAHMGPIFKLLSREKSPRRELSKLSQGTEGVTHAMPVEKKGILCKIVISIYVHPHPHH